MKKMFLFFCFLSVGCCLFAGTKVYYYVYETGWAEEHMGMNRIYHKNDDLSGVYYSEDQSDVIAHRNTTIDEYGKRLGDFKVAKNGDLHFYKADIEDDRHRNWSYGYISTIKHAEVE